MPTNPRYVTAVDPEARSITVEFPPAPPGAALEQGSAQASSPPASNGSGSWQRQQQQRGHGQQEQQQQGGQLSRVVLYRGAALDNIEPAWATTVHKAQGGEADVVVLVLTRAHRRLLRRQMLYTGARMFCLFFSRLRRQGSVGCSVVERRRGPRSGWYRSERGSWV